MLPVLLHVWMPRITNIEDDIDCEFIEYFNNFVEEAELYLAMMETDGTIQQARNFLVETVDIFKSKRDSYELIDCPL